MRTLVALLALSCAAFAATGDITSARIAGRPMQLDSTCAITSSTTSLICTDSPFQATDVGYPVYIAGAGAAGIELVASITAYTSATTVTIDTAASTTVGPTAVIHWQGIGDGWVIELTIAGMSTGGTYNFNLSTPTPGAYTFTAGTPTANTPYVTIPAP